MTDFVLQYWMQVGFGVLFTSLAGVANHTKIKIKQVSKEQDSIKLGIQALLRDRIIQSYNKHMDLGYIPIYALENLNAMYNEYHNLGGNGTITGLVEELRNLPKEDKRKDD